MNGNPAKIGNFTPFWFLVIMIPVGYALFCMVVIWDKNNFTEQHFEEWLGENVVAL